MMWRVSDMRKNLFRIILVGLGVIQLVGCASSAPPRYWHLQKNKFVEAGEETHKKTAVCAVEMGRIRVPEPFDRAEIVLNGPSQQIIFSGREYWVAPFPDVLAERLANRLTENFNEKRLQQKDTPPTTKRQETKVIVYPRHQVGLSADWQLQVTFSQIENRLNHHAAVFSAAVSWTMQGNLSALNRENKQFPASKFKQQLMQLGVRQESMGVGYESVVDAVGLAVDQIADSIWHDLAELDLCGQ